MYRLLYRPERHQQLAASLMQMHHQQVHLGQTFKWHHLTPSLVLLRYASFVYNDILQECVYYMSMLLCGIFLIPFIHAHIMVPLYPQYDVSISSRHTCMMTSQTRLTLV